MVSFLAVNYKTSFYANALISSLSEKWREENDIIIIDNSHDLQLDFHNIKVIQGNKSTHADGLDQGLKECKSNTIIISDIDCILIDHILLDTLSKFIDKGGAMIQCEGSSFKPFHPCFGALNKDIFLSENLSFKDKGQVAIPEDWENFFGISDFVKENQKVYLDTGVNSAYQLLRKGYKVSTIPKSYPIDYFNSLKSTGSTVGWWFGFEKPQVWHIVYGASPERFIKNNGCLIDTWQEKKDLVSLMLNYLVNNNI